MLNWVQIGTVGRQNQQVRPCIADCLANGLAFVAAKVVHYDDVAGFEGWGEHTLDVSAEDAAVDHAIKHPRRADPVAAVFAICLGSFVAILPNDSFYWLVRRSALEGQSDQRSIAVLSGGALVQALVGLAVLLFGAALWT